ncbi:unnamed protein product [Alopecurus aequalis]
MEMEAGLPDPRKRKLAALEAPDAAEAPNHRAQMEHQELTLPGEDGGQGGAGNGSSHLHGGVLESGRKLAAPASVEAPITEAVTADPEAPLPVMDRAEGGAAKDRISHLPDGVLGDIISLLPTKEGARTQILASRWRDLWRSAPLNLDHNWLCKDERATDSVVERILSGHLGPGRRFRAHVYHLHRDRADAWLRSPALDNLQELELCSSGHMFERFPHPPATSQPLLAAALRFCNTLCVAVFGNCQFPDSTAQALHFPKLKKLALERVSISESSLHAITASCPALECLLIQSCFGFRCVRINSITIRSVGCSNGFVPQRCLPFEQLIIENAPCLERLLHLGSNHPHTLVISAPKLETLGCLYSSSGTRLMFDSTVIQGLHVDSLTTAIHTVKILAVDLRALSLDAVIDLMRCFPCLERLYIESTGPGKTNLWRRKHRDFIRSFDIRVKTISWGCYRGIKSHVDFATFFVQNARVLELMILRVNREDYNEDFFAQQRNMLQLDRKASRGAQLRFTQSAPHRGTMFFRVHDLDLADPFERKDPYQFSALS